MISDDDLILYYYRELDAAERARIGAALSAQPQLAQRLQALVARLDAAAALPEVAVPSEVQRRWQVALDDAAKANEVGEPARVSKRRYFIPAFSAAMAAAVAVVLIFQLTKQSPSELSAEVAGPVSATPADALAYERGLKRHLASTERQLAGLGSASREERARLIETIVAQNKLYALAAERAGEPQLARVLRAFAPILENLAQGGSDSSANVAQLSFELRVMQGRLSAESGAMAQARSTTL